MSTINENPTESTSAPTQELSAPQSQEQSTISAEEQQWIKEEKLIRRPILSKSDSESGSSSCDEDDHDHNHDDKHKHASAHPSHNHQQSEDASSDLSSSSSDDEEDSDDDHRNHNHAHTHSHGGVPCTGHHHNNHSKPPQQQKQHNHPTNKPSNDHNHHEHTKSHSHSHSDHSNCNHSHSHTAHPQPSVSAQPTTTTTTAATQQSPNSKLQKQSSSSFSNLPNTTPKNSRQNSFSNITSLEDSNNLLKDLMKRCFYSSEPDASATSLEQSFTELTQFFAMIISNQSVDLLKGLLLDNFFKKITALSQLDHPKRCAKVVYLFDQLFTQQEVVKQILQNIRDHKRLIIDIANSYFILIEKFKNTPLELKAKMSFSRFQEVLNSQGFSQQLQVLANQESQENKLEQLSSEQKELLEMIQQFSRHATLQSKQEAVKYITLLLGKCESIIDQYKILVYHLPNVFSDLSKATFTTDEQRNSYMNSVLDILDRYIFPCEFIVNIDTARVQGSRAYHLNYLHSILSNFTKIFNVVAIFLNSTLLMPSDIQLSLRTLFIIRRIYYLFADNAQIKSLLEGPIITILSNLAVFAKESIQLKEPTLFLYKILDDPATLDSFKTKLESNGYVLRLKQNKYFGVRAKSYPMDIDVQYSFNTLNFQINYPVFKTIDAGSLYFHNILVTKPDTIIYWSFKTILYDIKYGLYKMDSLNTELQIEQYEQERAMKSIIKLAKVDSHKDPIMAYSLVNQPGLYRIVFDNTYSYWRSKELLYTIQILEP